ncbi:MAG: hypothetical protein IJU08_00730 [Bacteroidales bacterium]|nr:hypothetical protein [Bacteroidales bacterium]
MKRFLTFLAAMLLSFLPMNAIQPAFDGDDEDPEEIVIEHQQGNEPTQFNPCYISAFKTSSSVDVYINNYYGLASVTIIGAGDSVFDQVYVFGSALISLNISSLPKGFYTLLINAGSLYQGLFEK